MAGTFPSYISVLFRNFDSIAPARTTSFARLWQVHFLLHLLRKIYFPKLSKPPYICNGCYQRTRCSLEKHLYKASYTQKKYEQDRSESRSGFAFSKSKIKQLDSVEGTKCGAVLLTIHFVEQGLQLASSVRVMIPNLSLVCSTCSILD